ncbi:glycosyltransferase family 2 protein [Lignipirellula cremea]|uniref:Glycosyltransferase 2-like domain-containing protein n=1 Tax=Lignipirellula cremea TaxID=2528010 RepID=A0A518DPX2_9BACT|nr:glycosyltransferase family 2 protein [Lignipirellula cremea]QDU93885.1 hypothetical protein Pla8534_16700 [Lignipirellula cremea]
MRSERNPFVSVVLPVYNEAAALDALHQKIVSALSRETGGYEIVFVNDGSTDGSSLFLDRLADRHPQVVVVHLSRNFGHQAALQAGLATAQGDAIVVMDSDLQDDPAEIPRFLEQWRAGADVIYAVRQERKEGPVKRLLFYSFYRVLGALASTRIPQDAGNFCLLDGAAARRIVAMPESDRYFPGLRSWTGFRQVGLPVERGARYDAKPRVSLYGLFQLAKTALFSFSRAPLSMFYGIAGLSLAVCLASGCFTLFHKLVTGLAVPGWTSITIMTSLFGALNALGIAVLGEYVVRIYDQVRNRPQYVVARMRNGGMTPVVEEEILDEVRALSAEASTARTPTRDSACVAQRNARRQMVSRRESEF